MKKMKTISGILITAAILLCAFPVQVKAETDSPDYSDTSYWSSLCANVGSLSSSQESGCKAYLEYTASQSEQLSEQLTDIKSQTGEALTDTEDYDSQIAAYQKQVDFLSEQITDLESRISDLKEKMEEDRAEIEALKDKVLDQMEAYQSTMRLSTFVDVLAGAKSFADLLRIVSGLSSITQYHYENLTELKNRVSDLESSEAELENSRDSLLASQDGILMMQYAAIMVKEEYEQKQSEAAGSTTVSADSSTDTASSGSTSAAAEENGKTAEKTGTSEAESVTDPASDPAASSETPSASPSPTPAPTPASTPTPTPAPTPTPTPAPTPTPDNSSYADTEASAEGIYGLLTGTYGFTKAAACGILANIRIESWYDPTASSYGNYYYGLCQWGGGRQENLFEFCEENGYPSDSVNGQIAYMYCEMGWYSMIDLINSYENSADGAADAGVYFRTVFERSAGLDNVASIASDLYDSF